MRRTQDLHIQTIGLVPPVVKRSRCYHSRASPAAYEGAQRPVKPPDAHGANPVYRRTAEGAGEDQVGRGRAGQDAAKMDEQVRRRPEGVPADALMPGNVPDAPERS